MCNHNWVITCEHEGDPLLTCTECRAEMELSDVANLISAGQRIVSAYFDFSCEDSFTDPVFLRAVCLDIREALREKTR